MNLRNGGAVAPWGRIIVLLALLPVVASALAGCAGPDRTGATFSALSRRVDPPKAGHARIVVIRDKAFAGIIDAGWQVHLDGQPIGDLKTGTFVYRDARPGPRRLTFARPGDFSRASHRTVTAAAGRTYFFRLEMNDKGQLVQAAAISAGLSGLLISSAITAATDERGLFDFTPLEGATAQQAIAELRLAN